MRATTAPFTLGAIWTEPEPFVSGFEALVFGVYFAGAFATGARAFRHLWRIGGRREETRRKVALGNGKRRQKQAECKESHFTSSNP